MADGYEFDVDTRMKPIGGGRYETTITDRWGATGPRINGGFLLALCMGALQAELPFPDPLVVSAHFLRPAGPGPVSLATEVVRSGRRLATGEVRLSQGGREMVRAVASFTDFAKLDGQRHIVGEPPDLPPPDQCVDPMDSRPRGVHGVGARVEIRMPTRPGWMVGAPSGDPTAALWMRWRDGRPTDLESLPLFVDAVAPPILELGQHGSSTVELTVHLRARPAPGWVACRASSRFLAGGFHEEDFEIWDEDGTLVAQSRQLAILL